jgi:PAS domain S-box-containing protein
LTVTAIFIGFSALILTHLHFEKARLTTAWLQTQSQQFERAFNQLYNNYGRLSRSLYDTMINTPEVTWLMARANRGDPADSDAARAALLDLLAPKYALLKKENIRQLHFHLRNNHTFLRFHRPDLYGDDLSAVRPTVVFVNREHRPIQGFEEGKIFNGFRFVYPLFDGEAGYVGSVEISFSAMVFIEEMLQHSKAAYMLLSKSVVDEKVFDSEHDNYIEAPFRNFYYERSIVDRVNTLNRTDLAWGVSPMIVKGFDRKIAQGIPFSLYDETEHGFYTVIPLKNPVSRSVVGAIIINGDASPLESDLRHLMIVNLSYIMVAGVLLFVLFREWQLRNEISYSHEKLQTVIDEVDSGISIMDLQGNFLEVNPAYSRILGFSREEMLDHNCIDLTRPEEREEGVRKLQAVRHGRKLSKWRKTCYRKDGSQIYLEMSASLMPSKDRIVAVINSLEETLELESLNRELRLKQIEIGKQKEIFETLYEKSFDGILIIEEGKFINCNESVLRMTGYASKMALLQKHPADLSPKYQPDGRLSREKAEAMMELAREQGSHLFEWVHTREDGTEFWVEVVLTPIRMAKREIIHVLWRDISERKALEGELQQLNETLQQRVVEEVAKNSEKEKQMLHQSRLAQMGEMISMIAHQWRQPLSAISATAIDLSMKLMLEQYDKKQFQTKISKVSEYAQHLSKTIDDFRDFYKTNKEKRAVMPEQIFTSSLSIIGTSLQNQGITVETDYGAMQELYTYPNELKQVTLNLLKNAEDALLERGVENAMIRLRTYDRDGLVCFEVHDNAGGVPEGVLPQIFEPYFTTKENANGTGLGLYMSKLIVEEHCCGEIRVENVGDGARFVLCIPPSTKEAQ